MLLKISMIIHSVLSNKFTQLQEKIATNEKERKIMNCSALITYWILMIAPIVMLIIPGISYAEENSGLAGMLWRGADQADSSKDAMKIVFYAVGFCGVGYGCWNLFRKGKEGENSQVSATKILVPLLGGAALGGVAYMMKTSAETIGVDLE